MLERKMLFARIDDSPMFRQQIQSLEEISEILRDKCLKYYKGSRKYTGANPRVADLEGKTPSHLVSDLALNDVEILALMKGANRKQQRKSHSGVEFPRPTEARCKVQVFILPQRI